MQKIHSSIDSSIRDCHNKYFHTFDHICEYDINFTNITNNDTVNFTISDESVGLYELNKRKSLARERGFKFNQINKLTKKIYSQQRYVNTKCYLKSPMPMSHRQFFKILSQNSEYVKNHCNDLNNPFHFALQKWINQLN